MIPVRSTRQKYQGARNFEVSSPSLGLLSRLVISVTTLEQAFWKMKYVSPSAMNKFCKDIRSTTIPVYIHGDRGSRFVEFQRIAALCCRRSTGWMKKELVNIKIRPYHSIPSYMTICFHFTYGTLQDVYYYLLLFWRIQSFSLICPSKHSFCTGPLYCS